MAKKKQTAPVHIKDPKKVLAGKARAAKSLRVDGKFTSNKFFEEVQQAAESEGAKDPYKYFLQHEKEFTARYNMIEPQLSHQYEKLRDEIKNYKGRIFKNGKEVTKGTMLKNIAELNQYLRSEHDVVAWWQNFDLQLSGRMDIKFISPAQIEKQINEGSDIYEISESEGFGIIVSEPKKGNRNKSISAKEYKKEYSKKYRQAHKEDIAAYRKKYKQENKEAIKIAKQFKKLAGE